MIFPQKHKQNLHGTDTGVEEIAENDRGTYLGYLTYYG